MSKKKILKQKKEGKKVDFKKQAQDYLAGWQRAQADFENYKKEEKKRLEEFALLFRIGYVLKILPVFDSFEGALKGVLEEQKDNDWVKGILNIKKQLDEFLRQEEVVEIEAQGKDFDPRYHEAVGEAVGKKEDKDKVIQVIQKGYMMAGHVIRPARVYVGK